MEQRLLVSSILMGLCASLNFTPALAQSAGDQSSSGSDQEKKKDTLDTVVVTGSLIPRSQIETASPTITVTAGDIQKQGFGTVYDALKALPVANGTVQGNQSSGGFTQGAQTLSLFGLPPSYTLILLNGHPLTNYPLAYNGSGNITDLANIPAAMIDHIDIVTGGQSTIYGSSAIAGVINIVLKDKTDGIDLAVRDGGYTSGGGQNQRVQITGGGSWGKLDALFSLELLNQDPIYAYQRSYTNSVADNPTLVPGAPVIASRAILLESDPFSGTYADPGAAACEQNSNNFFNSLQYSFRPGHGFYCGTDKNIASASFLNQNREGSAYTSLKYHLNDNTELYTQILFSEAAQRFNIGGNFQFWESNESGQNNTSAGIFNNALTGTYQLEQRLFAPENYGGLNGSAETLYTREFNAVFGVRGTIGSSDYNYDAYYARSQQNTRDDYRHFSASAIDNYFLGPQEGNDKYGYPIYSPNPANLYKPFTDATFNALTVRIDNESVTWIQNLNLVVTNSDLFSLPAGSVGGAAVLQAGTESLNNPIPAFISSGDALGLTGATGAGSRKNYAAGAELRAPIISTLTLDASARYDDYSYGGNDNGKATYKVGFEFRPIDTLLLRANYGTAFRAPDMYSLFQGASGFFTADTDYYRCRLLGFTPATFANCPYGAPNSPVEFSGTQSGNINLKDVTAKTFTYGFVYSPIDKMNIQVDYQRANIQNEVQTLNIDTLLQREADCLIGKTSGGVAVDINSPSCQQYISEVHRTAPTAPIPNALTSVSVFPLNIANEFEDGIQASGSYRFDAGRIGSFTLNASYYVELKHTEQDLPGDPIVDVYHNPSFTPFKDNFTASVTWNFGNWSTTLLGLRYGSIPNFAETGTLAPWVIYNGSVKYSFESDASMALTVNNIRNSRPPIDKTQSAFPYYNTYNYNSYGRAVWLEFGFHFGGKKS